MSGEGFTLGNEHPLALLPVQLQARFTRATLRVRVMPDLVHGANHDTELTAAELAAGTAYWTDLQSGRNDDLTVRVARETLAGRVGPFRALWVAGRTRPSNWDEAIGDSALEIPKLEPIAAHAPMAARLLPDKWLLRAYDRDGVEVHRAASKRVAPDLRMAPSLGVVDEAATDRDHVMAFLKRQKLDWTVDFQAALDMGMAFEIDRSALPHHIGALLVCGVREGREPQQEARQLEDQLEAHWYRRGVDFLPQGTPTNNSDVGRTGFSVRSPDLNALFEADERRRPLAPLGRGVLVRARPEALYQLPAADTVALALGLVGASVLDRGAFAEMPEGLGAWAMNMAVGYATLGRYGSEILSRSDGSTGASAFLSNLREHYSAWVRAGAHLPVLRVGPQPYGLLPMCDPPAVYFGYSEDFEQKFDHYMSQLLQRFSGRGDAATLDPNATDGSPGSTPRESTLALLEVLGAVPHPTNLHLRDLTDHLAADGDTFDAIIGALDEAANLDQGPLREEPPGTFVFFNRDYWAPRKALITGIPSDAQPQASVPDIAAQWMHVELLIREVELHAPSYIRDQMMDIIESRLTPLMRLYLDAYRALPDLWAELFESGGLSGPTPPAVRRQSIPRMVGSTFSDVPTPVGDLVAKEGDLTGLATLLDSVIEALEAPGSPHKRTSLLDDAAPLLWHLIDDTWLRVPEDRAATVRLALLLLRARVASTAEADVRAELEWLLRSSLSLLMNRIDAWIVSRAAQKLARARQRQPTGLALGGYGWLLDLRASEEAQSQGFIHASNLAQAVTAGVLRSGWSAYGADSATMPLSVDLSSRRVRRGKWIVDALRNGQDLSEVLGAMLERSLHDRHLDAWIDDLRGAVNPIAGIRPARQRPIDGLLVARSGFDDATPQEESVGHAVDAVLARAGTVEAAGVREAVAEVRDALDSVADLAMTQAVYSLARGDADTAGAALSLTGGGDGSIPPLDAVQTRRDAQLVHHRVVLAVPLREAASDAPLEVAEPALFGWMARRLGDPQRIGAVVRVLGVEGQTLRSATVSLADCGLDVPSAAVLARPGVAQEGGQLVRIVAAFAKRRWGAEGELTIDAGDAGRAAMSLDDFGLLAAPLRRALGRGRALEPNDLLAPGEAPGPDVVVDDARLERRATGLAEVLASLATTVAHGPPDAVVPAAVQATVLGLPGGLLVAEDPDDTGRRDRLATALNERAVALGTSGVPLAERLAAAIGSALPILTPVPSGQAADLRRSLGQRARQQALAENADAWWHKVSRVRRNLADYAMHGLLFEATQQTSAIRPMLGQLPAHPREGWAAVERPSVDGRDRSCLFFVDGAPGVQRAEPLAGVVLDGWTEGIPSATQQTGIAWHFDSPSARPPQAVLLATTERDQLDADTLFEQVRHVITLMKLRATGPDRLRMRPPPHLPQDEGDPAYVEPAIGHYLPGAFLAEGAKVTGEDE